MTDITIHHYAGEFRISHNELEEILEHASRSKTMDSETADVLAELQHAIGFSKSEWRHEHM
jgi:hypothetical protein